MLDFKAEIFISIVTPAGNRQKNTQGLALAMVDELLERYGLKKSTFYRDILFQLSCSPATLSHLDLQLAATGVKALSAFQLVLRHLALSGYLRLSTATELPIATLTPISSEFAFVFPIVKRGIKYRLSRFAYLRRDESGDLVLETPRGFVRVCFHASLALTILHTLAAGNTIERIVNCHPTEWRQIAALLQLLLSGGFVEVCVDGNRIPEDANEALCQWEFHDLLFHVRSRLGRHDYPMGGLVPFLGRIAPQPAIKPSHRNLGQVTLFRPDLDKVARNDQPFTAILESRCSDRNHATVPVKLKTLGEFLFRVARIRSQFSMNRLVGSFTNRPYPNGGGLYEIEVYLTVNKCGGLKRGFYYYDALHHNLIVIAPPTDGMEMLLEEARSACAMTDQPNILITLASRFQRVSWKYQGIAYALMLKNIGVMQATMNLVATAMNLASCIVGVGNSDRFSKVAGTDYYKEGSTGEFILGSQVKTSKRFDSNSSK